MTSVVHPNQVRSTTVDSHIPIVIIPDVVSSSSSEAMSCFITTSVWDTRLQELATYKQQNNGSTNVPQVFPSNKPLGIWVKTQRQQYKLLQKNENSHMTTERIESLNELDFEWRVCVNNKWVCVNNTFWEDRFQELTIYKQANGSTNVPQRCPSNKPLGQWVSNQRTQYKLLQEGKTSAMTTEHIKSLNELDFEWVCVNNHFWEDRFQELTIYKQANGSTNVPRKFPSNKPLGIWVKTQRYQYKLLQDRKKSSMTTEHIKSLNELDFEWGHGKAKRSS
jgi:hypothetical protein